MPDLSEFYRQHASSQPIPDYLKMRGGIYAKEIFARGQTIAQANTVLSVILWQILIETAAFEQLCLGWKLGPVPWYERELKLVSHGSDTSPAFDLAIFDRTFGPVPQSLQVRAGNQDLRTAVDKWKRVRRTNIEALLRQQRITPAEHEYLSTLINVIDHGFAVDAANQRECYVLAARMPDVQYTSIPAMPWTVAPQPATLTSGSAGAVVRNQNNSSQFGITAAAHVVLPNMPANPGGFQVDVNGQSGTVVTFDYISDSCFVNLAYVGAPNHNHRSTSGLLQGALAPSLGTFATFEGCGTPTPRSGQIIAVSVNAFAQHPLVQQRFDFNTLSNQGDSGCALLDSTGHILGFALSRTNPTSNPSFSTWIWANSVFSVHGLQAF
jgi:hypothetical protein